MSAHRVAAPSALLLAALSHGGVARAQLWPTTDPWLSAPPLPPGPLAVDVTAGDLRATVIARAEAALAAREGETVVPILEAEVRRAGVALAGYDTLAVLLRLARRQGPAGRAAVEAPRGLPPPPPSEREAIERAIDGAVEILLADDRRAARAWITAALRARPALPDDHPLRSLARIAGGDREGTTAGVARGGRPEGTIDGAEAVTLVGLGGAYGLTLGLWSSIAFTDARGDAGAAQILVPMVGAAAGMVTVAIVDEQRVVRRGRGYAANAGFYLGLLGVLGVDLLAGSPLRGASNFERASAYLGGATVGIGVGIGVAHAVDADPGTATFTLSGGVWGGLVGAALDRGFRAEGGREVPPGAGLLVGGATGALAAMVTARWLRPTPTQTRWLDLGAIAGFFVGLLAAAKTDDPPAVALASGLGCIAGGALGYVLGAPSTPRERAMRATRRVTPGFTPAPGGGVFSVSL